MHLKPLEAHCAIIDSFMATMKTLVDEYTGGYEEWEKQNSDLLASVRRDGAHGSEVSNGG